MLHCDGAGCYSDSVRCYSVQDVGASGGEGCCSDDVGCSSVVCIIIGV